MEDQLDPCRVRAASVWVMEEAAANEGHSLLSFDDLLNRLMEKRLEERSLSTRIRSLHKPNLTSSMMNSC